MKMLEVIDHPLKADLPLDAGRIRELRLSRPPVNALNAELLRILSDAVARAGTQVDGVIVTGQPGICSAGLDVRALLALDRDGVFELFVEVWRAQRTIACSSVPIVFGLTGHSPAGGTVLAIYADYRVMALGDFRMGLNEVQVGLIPYGVIHGAFQRLVGGHTAQLLTRGALVDPATALRVGLVDELAEVSEVPARALEMAREMCALPREPMRRTREMVRKDLVALFGDPADAATLEREFATLGADFWFVPGTQERLHRMFTKR
jgi:Delta3-Delta2-enoyl-CoA isomerase